MRRWWRQARFKRQMSLYRLLRDYMTREEARLVMQSMLRNLER